MRALAACLALGLAALPGAAWGQITFVAPPADTTVLCQYVYPLQTVAAASTCPGAVNVERAEVRTDGTCPQAYTLTRTYTATDACGNRATHTQSIEVVDTQAPVIAGIPGNIVVPPGGTVPPSTTTPRAVDFCDPGATIQTDSTRVAGPCGGYSLIYTFTAADACGNARSARSVITVLVSEPPVITGVTPGGRLACGADLPAPPNVVATDDSSTPTLAVRVDSLYDRGGDTCLIVRRTWTATDDCQLETTAFQDFSFHDGEAPVISGVPADTVIYCEALPAPPALYAELTASDNCDARPAITFTEVSGQTNSGECSDVTYPVTRTWTAVDECGNAVSASQTLWVKCECCFNGIDDDDDGLADDYDPQCNCFAGVEAECDSTKMYFVPPVWHPSEPRYNQPSELVITTLADVANVHIMTGDGTTFNQTFTVVKGTPTIIPLTTNQLQTPNHDRIENDRGWVITSDQLIQPIYRIDGFYNKVLVTIKGPQAMGRVFRAGSQSSNCGRNDMGKGEGHFISVMATEDNTEVTLDFTFPALGGLTGPVTRTLNKFETYLIRDDIENTTVSGSLVTSTKPIVVMSGSQHTKACTYPDGNSVAQGMDGGIDQLVPNCLTGDEYVLVRGKQNQVQQYAVLVANKNNTRVVIDGNAAQEIELQAGEFTQVYLDGGAYQPKHFKANKAFYMFHVSGISTNNEVGMAIAAPVGECKGDTLIQFPTFDAANTSTAVDNSVYAILPASGLSSLTINGQPYTSCASAQPVPARADLRVVTFENACLDDNNVIRSDAFMTAGMLVGINRETGTHGYLTAFKDRMSVYAPGTDRATTGYLIDTLCGNQASSHCIDVASCATEHSIAAIRGNFGTVTLDSGTCFTYTSPPDFHGEDELFVTIQNNLGLFQTVCLRYFICAEPPEVDFPFLDTTVTCDAVPPLEEPAMSDECDMDIEFHSEELRDDGTCDYAYILYRNWVVWDDCGDSTFATQTIRVVDTTAPYVLDIPSDTLVASCSGLPPIPTPTFVENCDDDYEWSFREETTDSLCVYDRTVVRTWEAWDACGNRSTSVQRIELRDTSAPVITGPDLGDFVVPCTGAAGLPVVSASDGCDPDPTLTLDSVVIASVCDTLYHVLRTWTATDACGRATTATQRLMVIDLTSPIVLDVPADTTLLCGEPLPTDAPYFTDDCTNPVPVYTVDSVVAGTCPVVSTVFRRWVATDDCGNVTEARQRIEVIDTVGPQFIPLPDTIFSSCLDSVVVLEPGIVEACSFTLNFTDSIASGGNCNTERLLYRTYVAADDCGRESRYTQLYYFQDNVPPFWVQEPRDTLLQCDDPIPPVIDPRVADACSGLNPVGLVVRDSQRVCPARRWIFRTYTVSDWCGNLSTFTHTITIDGCEPAIPALATAQADCAGERITLASSVDSGYTTPVYLWQFSSDGAAWTDLAQPADSSTLTLFDAAAANSGQYRVVVADNVADLALADCSSTSPAVTLFVREPVYTTQAVDLCRGDSLFYLGDTLTQSVTRVDTLTGYQGCDSIATLELDVYPFVRRALDTVLCFGGSLTVYGRVYDQSGTYRDTLVTAYGCDTTLVLDLTVLPDLRDTTYGVLCAGGAPVRFEGVDHDAPGTYEFPLASAAGCDSTRVLVLERADGYSVAVDSVVCPGGTATVGTEVFDATGTYTRTLLSAAGCDSVVTLSLLVADTTTTRETRTLCRGDRYFFGGQVITDAGVYRERFASVYGCDSNVVLTVVESPVYDVEIDAELCDGEVYTNQNYSFTAPGRWPMTFYTADGCDSNVYVTLRYRPNFEVAVDTTICPGESYALLDTVIATPGRYRRAGLSRYGCDSVVTVTLDVLGDTESRIDTTLCFGESLLVGGVTYAATTTDTLLLANAVGCDSTVYLDLEVLPRAFRDSVAVLCEGQVWSDGRVAYDQTGVYRDTAVSAAGCDSVHTLYLTVIPTERDTLATSICAGDTLTLDGVPYFAAGTYDHYLTAASGCDSVVLVDLEVRDTARTAMRVDVCAGTPYEIQGYRFDEAGTYELDLTTASGCDSTVDLTLVHLQTRRSTRDTAVCFAETVVFGGDTLRASGTYRDTLVSSVGCDSIATLHLLVRGEAVGRDTVHVCAGDSLYVAGEARTSSGDYTERYVTARGCDSTHVTTLVVHDEYDVRERVELCFGQGVMLNDTLRETSGTYRALLSTAYGCDSLVTLEVVVTDEVLMAADDIRLCPGEEGQLHLRGYDGAVAWTPSAGLSCTDCAEPFVRVSETTTYRATATDCYGEQIVAEATVHVDGGVDVEIAGPQQLRLGQRARLVAVASNPDATLVWRADDALVCEGCNEIEVTPLATTVYELEADTEGGCDDVARLTIVVEDDCDFGEILVPNLVTPNGDGANDELVVRYDGVQEISLLRIFDRWGDLVYETRDIDRYWDATHHEQPVSSGVYVYYLTGYCLDGEEFTRQGNVTVVR